MGRNNVGGQFLTFVAQAVASYYGGPFAGAAAGAVVGLVSSRLATYDPTPGSRRENLNGSTNEYGESIPQIFGTYRVSGKIIWCEKLSERREEIGGGKGKVGQELYRYYANFAVVLCESKIKGVLRILANEKTIYSNEEEFNKIQHTPIDLYDRDNPIEDFFIGKSYQQKSKPLEINKQYGRIKIYKADEYQQASEHIRSYTRDANLENYHGYSYAVFENFEVTEYGNQIPALSFEVVRNDEEFYNTDVKDLKEKCLISSSRLINHAKSEYNSVSTYLNSFARIDSERLLILYRVQINRLKKNSDLYKKLEKMTTFSAYLKKTDKREKIYANEIIDIYYILSEYNFKEDNFKDVCLINQQTDKREKGDLYPMFYDFETTSDGNFFLNFINSSSDNRYKNLYSLQYNLKASRFDRVQVGAVQHELQHDTYYNSRFYNYLRNAYEATNFDFRDTTQNELAFLNTFNSINISTKTTVYKDSYNIFKFQKERIYDELNDRVLTQIYPIERFYFRDLNTYAINDKYAIILNKNSNEFELISCFNQKYNNITHVRSYLDVTTNTYVAEKLPYHQSLADIQTNVIKKVKLNSKVKKFSYFKSNYFYYYHNNFLIKDSSGVYVNENEITDKIAESIFNKINTIKTRQNTSKFSFTDNFKYFVKTKEDLKTSILIENNNISSYQNIVKIMINIYDKEVRDIKLTALVKINIATQDIVVEKIYTRDFNSNYRILDSNRESFIFSNRGLYSFENLEEIKKEDRYNKLSYVLKSLFRAAGLKDDEFNVEEIEKDDRKISGYIINNTSSLKDNLQQLSELYSFYSYEEDGQIIVKYRSKNILANIKRSELCDFNNKIEVEDVFKVQHTADAETPSEIALTYIDRHKDYDTNMLVLRTNENTNNIRRNVQTTASLELDDAKQLLQKIAEEINSGREQVEIQTSLKYDFLKVGDCISLEFENENRTYFILEKNKDNLLIKLVLSSITLDLHYEYSLDEQTYTDEQKYEKRTTVFSFLSNENKLYSDDQKYEISKLLIDEDEKNATVNARIRMNNYAIYDRVQIVNYDKNLTKILDFSAEEKQDKIDLESVIAVKKSEGLIFDYFTEQELIDNSYLNAIVVDNEVMRFFDLAEDEDYYYLSRLVRYVKNHNTFSNNVKNGLLYKLEDANEMLSLLNDENYKVNLYSQAYNNSTLLVDKKEIQIYNLSRDNLTYKNNVLSINNILNAFVNEPEYEYEILTTTRTESQLNFENGYNVINTKLNNIEISSDVKTIYVAYKVNDVKSNYVKV